MEVLGGHGEYVDICVGFMLVLERVFGVDKLVFVNVKIGESGF